MNRDLQSVEQIVAAARQLTASQREELCEQIAVSLDAPLTVEEAAWADVAERRAAELRNGQAAGVPADDVLARARRRLGL